MLRSYKHWIVFTIIVVIVEGSRYLVYTTRGQSAALGVLAIVIFISIKVTENKKQRKRING